MSSNADIPQNVADAFADRFDEGVLAGETREFPEQVLSEQMALEAYSAGLLCGDALSIADALGEENALHALACAYRFIEAHCAKKRGKGN